MATTTSLTTSYAGEFAGDYIIGALKSLKSVENLTLKTNINGSVVVKKLVDSVSAAALTCAFTPTGTVTITERELTPVWCQIHRTMCKTDFLNDWETKDMGPNKENFPAKLEDALIANLMGSAAQLMENNLWTGSAGSGTPDGFITLMVADADVIDVPSADAVTASTIVADIGRLFTASFGSTKGPAIHGSAELPKIYMNATMCYYWDLAQATLGNGYYFQSGAAINRKYLGKYEIVEAPGMQDNCMVLAQPSNLWVGTCGTNMQNQIKVLDMEDHDLSNEFRLKAQFSYGAQYGFGDEITMYNYPAGS